MKRRSGKYPFEKYYPLEIWTRIDQAGGKYGRFLCPICGEGLVDYKFTAGSGGCRTCKTNFYSCGSRPDLRIAGDKEKVPHWMWLCVDYDFSDDEKLTEIIIRRMSRETE